MMNVIKEQSRNIRYEIKLRGFEYKISNINIYLTTYAEIYIKILTHITIPESLLL
jgi:hypothetical protein